LAGPPDNRRIDFYENQSMGTFKACARFAMVLGVAGTAPSFEIGEIALTNTCVNMYVACFHHILYISLSRSAVCRVVLRPIAVAESGWGLVVWMNLVYP